MVLQVTFVHISWAKLGQTVIGTSMMSDDRRPRYQGSRPSALTLDLDDWLTGMEDF